MSNDVPLAIKLEIKNKELNKKLKESEKKLAKFGREAQKSGSSLKSAMSASKFPITVALTTAAASATAFAAAVAKTTAQLDVLAKTSRLIGTDVKTLVVLQKALGDSTGLASQAINTSLQRMVRRTSEAVNGTGVLVKVFEELNINANEFDKLSLDDKMIALSRALEGVESQSEKLRISVALFDSEGAKMLLGLQESAKAFENADMQIGRTAELMQMLSADSETFGDRLDDVSGSVNEVWLEFLNVTDVIDWMNKKLEASDKWLKKLANSIRAFGEYDSGILTDKTKALLEERRQQQQAKLTSKAKTPASQRKLSSVRKNASTASIEDGWLDSALATAIADESELDSVFRQREEADKREEERIARALFSLRVKYATEKEIALDAYADERKTLDDALNEKLILEEEYTERLKDARERRNEILEKIAKEQYDKEFEERNKNIALASDYATRIGEALMEGGKEQFEAGKAIALASAGVNTALAVSQVFADPTTTNPWTKAANIAVALAQGASIMSRIQSQEFDGQAHAGMTSIPGRGDSTWILQGGERVLAKEQNKDLTQFLRDRDSRSQVSVNIYNAPPNTKAEVTQREDGTLDIKLLTKQVAGEMVRMNSLGTDPYSRSLESTHGIARRYI